ncbi:Man1-Src1p-C-terminal domain [Popillia japonica]|uniref:Man1-Src1p-C-terminal domain n=1 Tax=Popillia japonica TaxID=7064 RepID=A0AAW1N1Y6_POPJA
MTRPYRPTYQRDYQSAKQMNAKNNLVSFAVIALAFLFFIFIAIAYMGLHSGQTAVDSIGASDLKVNYCDKAPGYKPGVNCIHLSQLRDAVRVYEIIKSELVKRSIDHRCISSSVKPYMTEQEIVEHINRNPNDFVHIHNSLRDMELLTLTNPQWETALVRISNDRMTGAPIKDFNELRDVRGTTEIALTILDPSLPWSCSIYNKIAAIIQTAVILAVGFTAVYSLNRGYKYYKHYQQKQKDELFYMVERIIDTLQTNATEDGENYLVINHVRDMILPINDRARMERTWKRAIDFINKNESRLQVVQGEPYEVWRWLGSPNLNTSGSRNKSWQGQAFETQVGSVNSLPCSPTPCLKIRGMVDDGDRNLHTIREAVLSKCAHQCRILHCAVDTNSKCVYLKCADQNDAAIAYRSLHGWWYAGNLVTVKYLRLERYLQRYPDSPVSGPPYLKALQPATDWSTIFTFFELPGVAGIANGFFNICKSKDLRFRCFKLLFPRFFFDGIKISVSPSFSGTSHSLDANKSLLPDLLGLSAIRIGVIRFCGSSLVLKSPFNLANLNGEDISSIEASGGVSVCLESRVDDVDEESSS